MTAQQWVEWVCLIFLMWLTVTAASFGFWLRIREMGK